MFLHGRKKKCIGTKTQSQHKIHTNKKPIIIFKNRIFVVYKGKEENRGETID
jgi:hypothetical protein